MAAADWEPIHGFATPGEHERFLKWIADGIDAGSIVEEPVGQRYAASNFDERWLRALGSTDIWRLVAPEPPIRGVFIPVDAAISD